MISIACMLEEVEEEAFHEVLLVEVSRVQVLVAAVSKEMVDYKRATNVEDQITLHEIVMPKVSNVMLAANLRDIL